MVRLVRGGQPYLTHKNDNVPRMRQEMSSIQRQLPSPHTLDLASIHWIFTGSRLVTFAHAARAVIKPIHSDVPIANVGRGRQEDLILIGFRDS